MANESVLYKKLKSAEPFFLFAGPNVIQSQEHVFKMCRQIKSVTDRRGVNKTLFLWNDIKSKMIYKIINAFLIKLMALVQPGRGICLQGEF